jgi:hypothetical protein
MRPRTVLFQYEPRFGDRVLAASFPFRDERDKPIYWIYNYKRGAFYPFVPFAGEQQRETSTSCGSRRRSARTCRSSPSSTAGSPLGRPFETIAPCRAHS